MASSIFGRKVAIGILVSFGSLTTLLAFQNCAPSNFEISQMNVKSTDLSSTGAASSAGASDQSSSNSGSSSSSNNSGAASGSGSGSGASGSGSTSTGSSPTPTPSSSSSGGTGPVSTPTPTPVPASSPAVVATPTPSVVATPTPVSSGYQPSQLYNFVAATKLDCDYSIQTRFPNSKLDCRLGGGCGVSCGAPGGSCESANPNSYGACINPDGVRAQPLDPGSIAGLVNIVNGNGLAACNASIQQNYPNSTATCKLGGGCGVSCGAPGPFCASANPNSYGACLAVDKSKAAPTGVCSLTKTDVESCNKPSFPASQLYNFVAGAKADCDSSIQSRFPGSTLDCRIGAGCGVSCGAPGGNCDSANPTVWGACINPDGTRAIPTTLPAYPPSQLYNIVVGGDQATCNATVQKTKPGTTATCKMGGGCGANSCGAPGPFCNAALPYYYGVCLNPDNTLARPSGIPQ